MQFTLSKIFIGALLFVVLASTSTTEAAPAGGYNSALKLAWENPQQFNPEHLQKYYQHKLKKYQAMTPIERELFFLKTGAKLRHIIEKHDTTEADLAKLNLRSSALMEAHDGFDGQQFRYSAGEAIKKIEALGNPLQS